MRAIAAAAGLSTGAIYHYYEKKEDILYDVMAASLSESTRISETARLGQRGPEDIRDEIALNIRKRFDKTEDNRLQFYLAVEAMRGDATLRGKFTGKYGEWVSRVEELLGFLYGSEPGPHQKALASLLLGAIDGASLQLLLGANQAGADEMARVYRLLLTDFLPGITARMKELDEEAAGPGPAREDSPA